MVATGMAKSIAASIHAIIMETKDLKIDYVSL